MKPIARGAQSYAAATVLLALASLASARIGETMEEADKRYGGFVQMEAGLDGFSMRIYKKDGIQITARFMDGKIGYLHFEKIDGSPFTAAEFKVLVRAQGVTVPVSANYLHEEPYWSAGDDKTVAFYDQEKKSVTVSTTEYLKRTGKVRMHHEQQEAEKKLNDF